MFRKEFVVGALATCFFFGLLGTSLAGEVIYDGSEAGGDKFTFAASTEVSDTVKNHVYDGETLAKVGTEAGNFEYRFDAPETKADVAARNYQYNQESLARIGTEAGDWEYNAEIAGNNANDAVAEKNSVKDAVCKGC
jgi:hypothetical protein